MIKYTDSAERLRELVEEQREEHLRKTGWRHTMFHHYWIWVKTVKDKHGVDFQLTAWNVKDAFRSQEVLETIEGVDYGTEGEPNAF